MAACGPGSTGADPGTRPKEYPVIAAVGDMACDPEDPHFNGGEGTRFDCAAGRVSDAVLEDTSLRMVLGLGGYQYDCSDPADWEVSYEPSWGRLDELMRPIPGDHEYKTKRDVHGDACPKSNSRAKSYFDYFGAAAHPESDGYYSFDRGDWHIIGLNANCWTIQGCRPTSPQTQWLEKDLAANTRTCILAYWHQPLFTGLGGAGSGDTYVPWWDILYAADADVVLNAHIHNYQRFPALDPDGRPAQLGITQYIVGTGGVDPVEAAPNAKVAALRSSTAFGYLRMTLRPAGWNSEFVAVDGRILDESSGVCNL
jgi:hypothetical protein